ncbi:MAG: molybdopterin-dependent oxidoreductase [Thermomicrobia bacterium]|nr:molybdopterin-dependent oxidoreductase [Thermomicrobia bacterium]
MIASAPTMSARATDWSLALCVGVAFATGLVGNNAGRPGLWWVFALHGIAGLALALFLIGKLRRVLPRLRHARRWDRRTNIGLLATICVLVTLGSGVWWVAGGTFDAAGFSLLNWHIALGLLLVLLVSAHMIARAKPLRFRDVAGRRRALRWLGLLAGGVALWPVQQRLVIADRRFTGSRPVGDHAGNAFPATSWVADRPRPLVPADWTLAVGGHVARPFIIAYDELSHADVQEATLDCTGGFASTQLWRGVRVGTLLDRAGVREGVGWVRFRSVTGYRWSLPLAEARDALLATHVEGEPLSHDHGAPLRLVAPGRRGFQWVKWIVAIDLLTAPDIGQTIAIHTSSFTPAGRGELRNPGFGVEGLSASGLIYSRRW